GMNSMFTRDFFTIAKRRLNRGGLFAQWFHIYNMPKDDLQSLLSAFTEVFPSAVLWKLNDGDVLLPGFESPRAVTLAALTQNAAQDLASVGVSDPRLLPDLYVIRDRDIRRFAAGAAPNTDDNPLLEFHGQRDLHAQTDFANSADFEAFARELPPPPGVEAL